MVRTIAGIEMEYFLQKCCFPHYPRLSLPGITGNELHKWALCAPKYLFMQDCFNI